VKKHYLFLIATAALILFIQPKIYAQSSSQDSSARLDANTVKEVDELLQQNTSTEEAAETSNEVISKPLTRKELKKLNISDYSNIISQTSYSDYSVIQRNYMPKSSRTQFKAGLSSVTNDVFYSNIGLGLGAAYFFNETWGVGLTGTLLTSNRNSYAENILDVQLVNIENLVTLKNTYGLNILFTPIYGKWSLQNKKVIPFELYFQGGFAQVSNQSNVASTAMTFGLGQLISLTRSSGLDINIDWYFYNTTNINNQQQSNNSMLLTVAYCWFWPKPSYR
jgi:outer membrane beta-barrel protein